MTIRQNFLKKTLMISAGVILLYTLIGFFLIPVIGKNIIQGNLTKALGRDVAIEKMGFNPFSLTAGIEGLKITEKNKDVFVSAGKISINLSTFSILILKPVISEIFLENPYVKIIQNPDGSFNFSDLMKKDKTENQARKDSKKGIFGFVLENIKITGGGVDFEDKKTGVTHQVKDFSFLLPFLSSREKDAATPANMDIQLNFNNAKGDIRIESAPFTEDMATRASLKISDVNVIHYLAYLPLPENLKMTSLNLGLDLHADMIWKDSKISLMIDGRVNASNAAIAGNADEKILSVPALSIEISPSDILSGQLNISKVLLSSPEINIARNENGDLNLLAYLPPPKSPSPGEAEKPMSFALSLEDLEIKDAVIALKDNSNKTPFETTISPLNLTVTHFKAGETISGEFQMSFKTLFDETFESKGDFQTGPVRAKGTLSMGNLFFNRYAPYYENFVGFDIRDGALDFALGFEMATDENETRVMIAGQEISIRSLSVMDRKAKEEIINIPEFKISGSTFDMGSRKIDTGTISARNGRILIKKDKENKFNIAETIVPEKKVEKTAPAPVVKTEKPADTPYVPWSITLNALEASGFSLLFNDLTVTEPVNIELSDIAVKAEGFRSFGEEKGKISTTMKWGKNGKIEISGDANPLNLNAGLDISLEKIDIKTLQPYFSDSVKILVSAGDINTKGKLLVDMKQKSGKTIKFNGETSLAGFSSQEKKSNEDFFKCNSLYLTGLDISLFPVVVSAKEISLTDFYSKIMVSESGELNLASVFKTDSPKDKKTDAADPQKAAPSSEKPKINIEKITLQGGNIDFSDFLTKPNFKAGMKEIAGSLTGLSSDEQSRAKLHLQGLHSSSSPLEILGTINLLAEKKFAEVGISFKNIELSNFTPYSSKYLGYKIDKGKLILDLKYMIDGNVLKSENRARFDNFELGEKVDSEHATSLPISLAISLLKNRDGQIDLDLPVEGQLDDPEFKIGPIILKMIGNMILKVITSPFSVIGSMFGGGGEELGFAEFEYGDSVIKENDSGKIDKLIEILTEKPSVKLEIQGVYNAARDAEGIREKRFDDLLKEERSKKSWYSLPFSKIPEKNAPLTAEEREKYTEKVYDKAQFPKPRDEKGSKKKLDLEEKKKLLITHINIDENDLRSLAVERAENIRAYILSTGKVEKERIYLLEPMAIEKEKVDQTGRVNFLLK